MGATAIAAAARRLSGFCDGQPGTNAAEPRQETAVPGQARPSHGGAQAGRGWMRDGKTGAWRGPVIGCLNLRLDVILKWPRCLHPGLKATRLQRWRFWLGQTGSPL